MTLSKRLHQGGAHGATRVAPEPAHLPAIPDGEGCLVVLSNQLRQSPGVVAIEANFRDSTLLVRYEPARVSPDELNALADEVGAMFAQRVTLCEQREAAGSCSACALRLGALGAEAQREFETVAMPGRVGLRRRTLPDDSVEVVRPLSHAKPWGARNSPDEQERLSDGRAMQALMLTCLALLVAGGIAERMGAAPWLPQALFVVSAVCGGWFAARSTFAALREGRFDVNLLMLLAAAGAAAIGYAFEAAVLMFLFSLSNTLEVLTMGRTRRALHALLRLRPARALVLRDGREVEVEAEAVRVGERVVVRPGEAIAVDGQVVRGDSLVDQSNLTGESVPVEKAAGDTVYAGTLNQQGALEVLVTRAASQTALARIVRLVQEAQEQKSRTEELAEWAGRYYTIAVIVGAGLMLLIPPLVMGAAWKDAFYRAMTLLVVASPCALVIATPATILSAIANAARNGILFKGGRFIEALARVKVLAFDKTGTLTRGRFEVTDVVPLGDARAADLLAWAAAAEKRSPHPLAQAVVRAADARGLTYQPAEQLTNHLGKGLVAMVGGTSVEIGTPELFAALGVTPPSTGLERLAAFTGEAKTSMLVRRGDDWGVIAAADELRATAAGTLRDLRALGIARIAVVSGDHPRTVETLADRAGADEHHGGLLPEDKVRILGALESRGPVAMVGDGVNDAPALARASVGIAMGGIGSDAAMESADVVLMADDLTALPYAVRLAKRARTVVAQNIVIATGVMLVLVAWVFAGHHTPFGALKLPVAVSGHEGSTVVVILNGLRLLTGKRAGVGRTPTATPSPRAA